jgi:dolichol-phosphate mannosyltransferase
LAIDYEVLVVDTIEPLDNTRAVCQEYDVKYLNRKNGNNYGDAIRTGIQAACGEKIIFMAADGSHSPEFILKLLEYQDSDDVVIASRYIKGGYTENSKILVLMSKILNITYSIFLNIKCKDISNSFKLYDASFIKSINLYCDNFDIVEEILYKLSKNNKKLRIKEIPYTFKARIFGKTKRNLLLFMISYLVTMLKLRFGK